MARITLAAALFGGAAAQMGSWQTLAGYQTASDVGPHAMIDLDMAEFETQCGLKTAAGFTEALRIYEKGGNGTCAVAGANGAGCAAGAAYGNSRKSDSIRTLKGFATKNYNTAKLRGTDGGKYGEQLPPIYACYWNDWTWADSFVTNSYSNVKDNGRAELMKKGANYQAVWMYVLHKLEDTVAECYSGDEDASNEWDEGWAIYAGSMVAATAADAARSSTASQEGTLIWELAEKRGSDFGTLDSTGPATVNVNLLAKFIMGRDLIIDAKCAEAESLVDPIRAQMTVPLVQGTLKYAYKADPTNAGGDCVADAGMNATTASDGCVKSWAEAWAFAAAVLPQIAECDWGVAEKIRYSLDIEAATPVQGGFYSVKAAIESTYPCLGITCADVGAYAGTMPCGDPGPTDDDDDDDDDLLDGGLREVMSLAPMGLAAIGITFTGITIATLVNLAQEQCALGPTIIFEAGTTHPYYITPNLCTIGAHTYSSKKTVRDASPRKVCRKFCEAASASGKLALKQVHGLTCYCKRK